MSCSLPPYRAPFKTSGAAKLADEASQHPPEAAHHIHTKHDALESPGERVKLARLFDVGGAAEIDQADEAGRVHRNVLVLDVAVNDRVFVQEPQRVGYLSEDVVDVGRRKPVRMRVDIVKQVLTATRSRIRRGSRRRLWHDEEVEFRVLPIVEKWANARVARPNCPAVFSAVPQVELRRRIAPDGFPLEAFRVAASCDVVQRRPRFVRHAPQVVEDVHFDRDRAEDLVLLPAVGEDPLLDDVLDDQLGLQCRVASVLESCVLA